jgi:hypothetical protein
MEEVEAVAAEGGEVLARALEEVEVEALARMLQAVVEADSRPHRSTTPGPTRGPTTSEAPA